MDKSSDEYHISFFKPTTPQAKANRDMVVWLVLVWFIAIFGFQIVLRVIEKPTPEPAYITFQKAWGNVTQNNASAEDLQGLGQSTLSVLGKIAISPTERTTLDHAMSWSIYQLAEGAQRANIVQQIKEFENLKGSIQNISDAEYLKGKATLSAEIGPMLNLAAQDIRAKLLPLELSSANLENLNDATVENLPVIMKKYLVHNQSFLTDWRFLGFPFHYFYTAIFLLILFVGLCLLYCVKTDMLNAKLNIVD